MLGGEESKASEMIGVGTRKLDELDRSELDGK